MWKKIYNCNLREEIDRLIIRNKSINDIYTFFKDNKYKNISKKSIKSYFDYWPIIVLKDTLEEYYNLCKKLEGWIMLEYDEEELIQNQDKRNSFRREVIIARTEYKLRDLESKNLPDPKTYKDLTSLILTAINQQEASEDRKNKSKSGFEPINNNNGSSELTSEQIKQRAINHSDLEKYLLNKSPDESKVIRMFLNDMNILFNVVDLNDYELKK